MVTIVVSSATLAFMALRQKCAFLSKHHEGRFTAGEQPGRNEGEQTPRSVCGGSEGEHMCVKQFAQRGLCVVEKAGVDSHPRDGTVQRSFALGERRSHPNEIRSSVSSPRYEYVEKFSNSYPWIVRCSKPATRSAVISARPSLTARSQNGLLKSAARPEVGVQISYLSSSRQPSFRGWSLHWIR